MTQQSLELVEQLKRADQDHEFYPTTREIIAATIRNLEGKRYSYHELRSVLDIGAGNGKVLMAFKEQAEFKELYAIEKSHILCQQLPSEVLIVGTEFREQSLLSKVVDVVFCNPPYSEYEDWAEKIIREAEAYLVYLVIPDRWQDSIRIADAIKFRDAEFHAVGDFNFQSSEDRQARARVQLVRVELHRDRHSEATDAFTRFFNEQFAELIANYEAGGKPKSDTEAREEESKNRFDKLVIGPNYPAALVAMYREEMESVQRNYHLVGRLDVSLLKEFDISPERIMGCLKERMKGMRNTYWHELFSHLSTVTDRLTSASRKNLLETLYRHVAVDFTESNILEVVFWVIKNANRYIESQMVAVYEQMVAKCNCVLYKSNRKVWAENKWRYNDMEGMSHYALDYRIVTHRLGGCRAGYSFEKGLSETSGEFGGDLLTIARNLGFRCETMDGRLTREGRREWKSGKPESFYYQNGHSEELFEMRGFLNGNVHLRLNKKFILALNVEHGRLKGWLRSGEEAAEELKDPQAAQYFDSTIKLGRGNLPMIAERSAA